MKIQYHTTFLFLKNIKLNMIVSMKHLIIFCVHYIKQVIQQQVIHVQCNIILYIQEAYGLQPDTYDTTKIIKALCNP
jgi:hypothetical protein